MSEEVKLCKVCDCVMTGTEPIKGDLCHDCRIDHLTAENERLKRQVEELKEPLDCGPNCTVLEAAWGNRKALEDMGNKLQQLHSTLLTVKEALERIAVKTGETTGFITHSNAEATIRYVYELTQQALKSLEPLVK